MSKNPNFKKYDVWSIMQDSKGTIWCATTFGVYCFDGKSFSRFLDNDSVSNKLGFQSNRVEYILEDKAGNFWFGGRGNNGVFRYDGKTMSKLNIKQQEWSWPLLEDSKGNIWFSNWGDVYTYNAYQSNAVFIKLEGYSIQNTTRIIEDKEGNIWLGSDSKIGGVHRYDGKSFIHYNTAEGLKNNSIWMILQDKTASLWIGARNTELYKFDGKSFIPFSK
jgi:ligand-binding sensor domain-containing protein